MLALTDHVVDEDAAIRLLTRRLARDYAGRFTPEEVDNVVAQARQRFAQAKVRLYIPVLVDRAARELLDGKAGGAAPAALVGEGRVAPPRTDPFVPIATGQDRDCPAGP